MRVVCDAPQKSLVDGLETVTPDQFAAFLRIATGTFAVIPPLSPKAEWDLSQYAYATRVVVFVLFRDSGELDLIRLVFGNHIRLAPPTWENTALARIPALGRYLDIRKTTRVIEFADVDITGFESTVETDDGYLFDDVDETGDGHEGPDIGAKRQAKSSAPPITPLATLGKSDAVCAGATRFGKSIVVVVPLGEGIDLDDAAYLEQTASALLRRRGRKCIWISWQDPNHPSLAVDGSDPRPVGHQPAAILTALWMGQGTTTLADIHGAFDNLANLEHPVGATIGPTEARETDNRVQKLNELLKREFGVVLPVCTSTGKRDQRRVVSSKIDLYVTDLPFAAGPPSSPGYA